MTPENEQLAVEPRRHNFFSWFDIESAAVVTILMGVFQLLLCSSLIQVNLILPKSFYILPLVLGIVMIAGGSFTMASERNKSKLMVRGSAWSNALGLLGSLLGFGIYIYIINSADILEPCMTTLHHGNNSCRLETLANYIWSITLQLLLYDTATVVMHLLLSVCAFKDLKSV